jgi:bifunctional UDP-N-acetylglucosamine pyrophosphorylase/glucosamine-1-phosphate N-acetyltransferase
VARPETCEAVAAIAAASGLGETRVVVQPQALGMADAVLCARDALLETDDGPLYVTQAQDVVDPALHASVLDRWEREGAGLGGLLAAVRVASYFPGGYLTLKGERVTSVVEKPGAGNEPSDLVNLVAHVFATARALVAALMQQAAQPVADDAYERALSHLMQTQEFRVLPYEGRWEALKYPWHLLDVMDMLLERWTRGLESPGPDYEQREDGVFVGRDVRIFPGAYVVAPALIGHGSVVGHNALVRGSLVAPRCVVGFGSEVARSYIAEGVELLHNYVGDSVRDRESAMGYGAVTANSRLDGRSVPMFAGSERIDTGRMKLGLVFGARARLGVNVSTMPGVKIGAGANIGPNLRVTRDVPEDARVLNESEYGRL